METQKNNMQRVLFRIRRATKAAIGLWLIILLCCPARNVFAARETNYNFMHIDSRHGLSSNHVKAIARDPLGFVWVGTKNGLNRYDGSGIRHYNCYDAELGRGNNNIGALYVGGDSCLWIGTDRGLYVYDFRSERISYVGRKTADGVEAHNWVQRIAGDDNGDVWGLLPDVGLFQFNKNDVRLFTFGAQEDLKKVHPTDVLVSRKGTVWVITTGNGLFRYDSMSNKFREVSMNGAIDGKGMIWCSIDENTDGNLVLATADGRIFLFNPMSREVVELPFSQASRTYLRCIKCFDNEVWIGTQSGLFILNLLDGSEVALRENPLSEFSLSNDAIYCLAGDSSGNAWVGTTFGGVNYYLRQRFSFENYGLDHGLSSRLIIGLASDYAGRVWIGTENAGINVFDPETGRIERADFFQTEDYVVLNMESYDGAVYASFSNNGLQRLARGETRPTQLFPKIEGRDNNVYSFLIDSKGNEWIGLSYALYRRDAGKAEFRHITDTSLDWIYALAEGRDGMVWIGTMGNGIIKYNPADDSYVRYDYNGKSDNPNGLRSNSINSIYEDSQGNMWFSTDRGGLSRYNKTTDDFTTFGIEEGLPDDMVYGVLEDKRGYLWFGTSRGLVRFDPATARLRVFTTKDGIAGDQYNYKSTLRTPDGKFYFGGTHGVVAFAPDEYSESTHRPELYFTGLKVMGQDVEVGGEGSPLRESILFTRDFKLTHNQSTFSLTVASPNLLSASSDMKYRLLPVNKEWVSMNDNDISFVNLADGKYTLEVRADNDDNVGTRRLQVTVLAPWWRAGWAYAFYTVILLGVILVWFFWYRNRKEQQLHERQEIFAAEKEKEVYRSKVNFFTEIAHEIRTPLSLIDLPLEAIEAIEIDNQYVKRYVKVSRQNVNRLLELTGQLLDFEKIDSHRLTLKPENVDVPDLVNKIADRFEPAFMLKGRTVVRELDSCPLVVAIDREAITKIISNLLNNALKYGNHTVRIILDCGEKEFRIKVASDGTKIPVEERESIFNSFYQTMDAQMEKNGVGIGLPLSRSLAILLGGSLTLDDNPDDLNIFTLTLPVSAPITERTIDARQEMASYMISEESDFAKPRSEVYTVLLVEDNADILSFMTEQLRKSFLVETATNGMEALDVIRRAQIDIIVTDIMMPVMDGLELCRTVKGDINISHIPVIFITAKNDLDSKVQGLQYGAEGYVEKPFSIKYLKQLVRSILDNRRRERESFSKNPFYSVDNMQMNKADEEFMNKVREIITDNVSEEEFNVERMCDLLCMSRSSLLRKIKTLFNLSPVELIRVIKLKKAAELIADGHYRISDVCYMVGITSPSYFSKLFFKQFGMTPKDFEKQSRARTQQNDTEEEEYPDSDV